MTTSSPVTTSPRIPALHKGPHPGILAVLYTVLFCAGLYPVTRVSR